MKNEWKFFIGVGDGREGFGGNWADFMKKKERPKDASRYLLEVPKEEFINFLNEHKSILDFEGDPKEITENDEEFYCSSNGKNQDELEEALRGIQNRYI